MTWHIIGILAFVVIYNLYRYYHENNDDDYSPVKTTTAESNHIETAHMEETISTRQLALKTIENIGSKPEWVRQVVNDINMRGTLSVFYGITDSDDVAVHIKKHFLFVQQIPDLESYLKITLDSFFRTARTLDIEVEKCRLQECER